MPRQYIYPILDFKNPGAQLVARYDASCDELMEEIGAMFIQKMIHLPTTPHFLLLGKEQYKKLVAFKCEENGQKPVELPDIHEGMLIVILDKEHYLDIIPCATSAMEYLIRKEEEQHETTITDAR